MKKILKAFVYIFAIIGFVLTVGYIAIRTGLTKTSGMEDRQRYSFSEASKDMITWSTSEEWQTLKVAISRDKTSIVRAAQEAGVDPRTLVSLLATEQLRLFNSNREIFKSVFEPLKILGVQTQYSWGVMGVKEDTARAIESHLNDATSPFYPGPEYTDLLDFSTPDHDTERFNRLTDENDRYYSYLYAGLYLKEIESQWEKSGFPIDSRPEILATLYDIGFGNSHPNASPAAGGAEINIGTTTYSFGGLAASFYYSGELASDFPVQK